GAERGLMTRTAQLSSKVVTPTELKTLSLHDALPILNQVVCKVSRERVYSNNGPESNLFGLEPTFGCCLANMHQGWPKLVSHLWIDRKSTRLNSSHDQISYAVFCLKKKHSGLWRLHNP